MTALPASPATLSLAEARSLTDEVKNDAERLWRKLVELYEGDAHTTLGYSSWSKYFKVEFGGSTSRAYQILDAGRIVKTIEAASIPRIVESPRSEWVARELRPLLSEPKKLAEAWVEATEINPTPSATLVREIVAEKVGPMSNKATINANAAKRKVFDALASISGYCGSLPHVDLERACATATPDDIAAWERISCDAVRDLNTFRRSVKEAQK